MKSCIKPGMIVVDVGAAFGYHALHAARLVGPNGKVYAVEPASDNLEMLYKNIKINGFSNITVLPYAAGSDHGMRSLYQRDQIWAHSLFPDHPDSEVIKTVEVREVTLDSVLEESKVDLVKIDVEGAEIEVIRGMKRIIQSNPDIRLIVEWNPSALQKAGYSAESLPKFLIQLGFKLSVIDYEIQHLQSVNEVRELLRSNQLCNLRYVDLYVEHTEISLKKVLI
jgi:FkbM family methyltransferase